MRLGVFFLGSPRSGGLYQYALSILDSLHPRKKDVIIFNLSGADFPREKYRHFRVREQPACMGRLKRLGASLVVRSDTQVLPPAPAGKEGRAKRPLAVRLSERLDILYLRTALKMNRVRLVLYTAPTDLSFRVGLPYIMPVHDLQHRLNPQFPEVSADGVWQQREHLYSNAIPGAEAILVESEIGKEIILSFYPADRERIKVLPLAPPGYLRPDYTEEELSQIREKYHLPPRFIFYPANFWAHKNHRLIIGALARLKEAHNLVVPAVFSGGNPARYGELDNIRGMAERQGVSDQIYYPGYVPNEDMGCFYKLAEALVMPTFFGPTNIPYLEAFMLGCPVIGSDIKGIREQIADAGLLVDLHSPEQLAAAIFKLWNDAGSKETLIRKGYERIKLWSAERFAETLNRVLDDVEARTSSR